MSKCSRCHRTLKNPKSIENQMGKVCSEKSKEIAKRQLPLPLLQVHPLRIQCSRKKGFHLISPNGLPNIYVDRRSKYGNPYNDIKRYGIELCIKLYENTARGIWDPTILKHLPDKEVHQLYSKHTKWINRFDEHPIFTIKRELKDKNLICWCKLTVICHADVLLKIANE